jgi:hypothetical protein
MDLRLRRKIYRKISQKNGKVAEFATQQRVEQAGGSGRRN